MHMHTFAHDCPSAYSVPMEINTLLTESRTFYPPSMLVSDAESGNMGFFCS